MRTPTAIEALLLAIQMLEAMERDDVLDEQERAQLKRLRDARDSHLDEELKRQRAQEQIRHLSRDTRRA